MQTTIPILSTKQFDVWKTKQLEAGRRLLVNDDGTFFRIVSLNINPDVEDDLEEVVHVNHLEILGQWVNSIFN